MGTILFWGDIMNQFSKAHWGSRLAFILAAAGSAIGLGNIWKFPYMAGKNGGGAFVLVYLLCIAAVGLPILIAEIFMGKQSQGNAVTAFEHFDKPKTHWRKVGVMGMLASSLVLAFYSVVGGWVLNFEFQSLTNQLFSQSDETLKTYLSELITHKPLVQIFWHTVFMGLTLGIVIKGISKGIEKWTKILMPILFFLLGFLLIYTLFLKGFSDSISFLFKPDFSQLSWSAILEAVGHSFFTLTIGMSTMIVYGSYLQTNQSVFGSAIIVALLDTVIALIAGIIVFAVVFSFDQSPEAGPSLMFVTLPLLFKQMPGSWLIANAFFILVAFAALSSSISMIEVSISYFTESKNWTRKKATLVLGGSIWALGILCVFPELILLGGKNVFDVLDIATSKVMLPLGGLLISLFFGWVVIPKSLPEITKEIHPLAAQGLLWVTRIFAPLMVGIMLFNGIKEMLFS